MDEVVVFLRKHKDSDGSVGAFVRSCLLVAEMSEILTRSELKDSAQMGYLLDCFPTADDPEEASDG